MSIELTGPEKFKFQDLVCISLALELAGSVSSLIVEPANGEDAELVMNTLGSQLRIEVQVKGGKGDVTLRSVAQFLSHFPPRRSKDCLFERLLADQSRHVLFVVSGRCTDDARPFVVEAVSSSLVQREKLVTKTVAADLLAQFQKPWGASDTRLRRTQRQHRIAISKQTSWQQALGAARRISILERTTAEKIYEICRGTLVQKFRVPADRTGDIINRLRDDVENAKRNRADILPLVRKTLEKSACCF